MAFRLARTQVATGTRRGDATAFRSLEILDCNGAGPLRRTCVTGTGPHVAAFSLFSFSTTSFWSLVLTKWVPDFL